MQDSTSMLREGDFVKLRGWKKMKKIVEIIDRGNGWLSAMVQNGTNMEYTVIEDWRIENVKSGRPRRLTWEEAMTG